jgi:integrase
MGAIWKTMPKDKYNQFLCHKWNEEAWVHRYWLQHIDFTSNLGHHFVWHKKKSSLRMYDHGRKGEKMHRKMCVHAQFLVQSALSEKGERSDKRQFQNFTKSKDPSLLSTPDVRNFPAHLAADRHVAASTQNQAFNALLFFYRHILKNEFGDLKDVPRAKRKPYIPVVLSREEIEAIISRLSSPYDLIVKLLHGCGLRLSEGMKLRVGCFNFDTLILTVHDGKGKKDRTVPIPETIVPELKTHLQSVIELHQKDLKTGYAGTFLPDLLKKIQKCCQGTGLAVVFSRKDLDPYPGDKRIQALPSL